MITSMKNVIAQRSLYLMGDTNKVIIVKIACPEPSEQDYECTFTIDGVNEETILKKAYGVDSVQALASAFQKISHLLNFYNETIFDKKLRWLDDKMTGPLFEFNF
jgi:hypothetical protein